MKVEFYTKDNCPLCEEGYSLLMLLQNKYRFELEERDIYTNDTWLEEYQLLIPVVRVNETLITGEEMDIGTLEKAFLENMENN